MVVDYASFLRALALAFRKMAVFDQYMLQNVI